MSYKYNKEKRKKENILLIKKKVNDSASDTDSEIFAIQQLLYEELSDIEQKVFDNLKKNTDLQ
ncbi:MAG: hypothetical protein IPM42_07990 [Saprospiraceae bacterium]|nr:hypothetical protein [Saprospiraceae bacterium]